MNNTQIESYRSWLLSHISTYPGAGTEHRAVIGYADVLAKFDEIRGSDMDEDPKLQKCTICELTIQFGNMSVRRRLDALKQEG